MKQIRNLFSGQLKKTLAIMSIITVMFLFFTTPLRTWGANKTILKLGGTSFALIAPLSKKLKDKGVELSDDEVKLYDALDAHIKEYSTGTLTEENFGKQFATIWSKMDQAGKDKFISEIGLKAISDSLIAVQAKTDQLSTAGIPKAGGKTLSLKEQIKAALMDPKVAEMRKEMMTGHNQNTNFKFEVKAIAPGSTESIGSATATGQTQPIFPSPEFIPGLNNVARNQPFIIQLLNVMNTSSATIIYLEKYNPSTPGSALWVAEGAAAPQVSFDIRTANSQAKMVDAFIKVTTQMLDDVDYMASEIEKELIYQIGISIDTFLLQGDGIGADLAGIKAFASNYVLTSLSTTLPNNCDAVLAAAAQIAHDNFIPDVCVMNPLDVANTKLLKGTTGYYVINPNNEKDTWAGIRVVASNQVPLGTIMVMDSAKTNVYRYQDFMLSYGWINDDFQKNYVSIKATQRLHSFVKANDTNAFVYDTLANIKAAITAV